MDFDVVKWQMVRGAMARRLILACLCFMIAMVIVSFTSMSSYEIIGTNINNEQILVNLDECSLDNMKNIKNVGSSKNLSASVVEELIKKEILSVDSRALCVGEDSVLDVLTLKELGFNEAFSVYKSPISSLLQKQVIDHQFEFETNSFDFVLSRTFNDKVPIPARLVLEIERVLRPGGIGVMLVSSLGISLVRSVTPVSLLLRSSEIFHVCGIGSFALIVFKKKLNNVVDFKDFKLPSVCPSISRNSPFMKHLEPLKENDQKKFVSNYLPEFMNVSSRNKLIYINMGMGELGSSYPIHPQMFNIYVVDHNVSVLTSAYVKKPGVTFIYHPGLVENNKVAPSVNHVDYYEAPLHGKRFEFVKWFKETAKDGDFVVLKMNADVTQLKVLFELFESGAICHVDEMFIHCSEDFDCRNRRCNDCLSLFKGLRNVGVFVHRWSGV